MADMANRNTETFLVDPANWEKVPKKARRRLNEDRNGGSKPLDHDTRSSRWQEVELSFPDSRIGKSTSGYTLDRFSQLEEQGRIVDVMEDIVLVADSFLGELGSDRPDIPSVSAFMSAMHHDLTNLVELSNSFHDSATLTLIDHLERTLLGLNQKGFFSPGPTISRVSRYLEKDGFRKKAEFARRMYDRDRSISQSSTVSSSGAGKQASAELLDELYNQRIQMVRKLRASLGLYQIWSTEEALKMFELEHRIEVAGGYLHARVFEAIGIEDYAVISILKSFVEVLKLDVKGLEKDLSKLHAKRFDDRTYVKARNHFNHIRRLEAQQERSAYIERAVTGFLHGTWSSVRELGRDLSIEQFVVAFGGSFEGLTRAAFDGGANDSSVVAQRAANIGKGGRKERTAVKPRSKRLPSPTRNSDKANAQPADLSNTGLTDRQRELTRRVTTMFPISR